MKQYLKLITFNKKEELIAIDIIKNYHISRIIMQNQDKLGDDESTWLKKAVKMTDKSFIDDQYILKWVYQNLDFVIDYLNSVEGLMIRNIAALEIIHLHEN